MRDAIIEYIKKRKDELYQNYISAENNGQHFSSMISVHRKNELEELLKWIESQ